MHNQEFTSASLFRTVVDLQRSTHLIDSDSPICFTGSCFAGNVGRYFTDLRFPALVNPFGVLYNPLSVGNSLLHVIEKRSFNSDDLLFYDGLWHSMDHHGSFSRRQPQETLSLINSTIDKTAHFLKNAHFLIITFGTSYVFEFKESSKIVANCHRVPASRFTRYRLDPASIVTFYSTIFEKLKEFNPALNIILTVSPVRHLKDGAVDNQRSKAALLLAVEKLTCSYSNLFYFPSYEIVMDELRDYRFYNEDMVQPSKVAVDYITDRFIDTYLTYKAKEYLREALKKRKDIDHRFSGYNKEAYYKFLLRCVARLEEFQKRYSFSNWSEDLKLLKERINSL
ncbi:GSCFA domain-containing protein [Marinilabiliaceae bacterium ANBcel2]|nr:GSCFA domain-containing protein [Marinilabiliaceae bacterium ANBcel2]